MILAEQVMAECGSGPARLTQAWLAPGARVLEIGCSSGYLTPRFVGSGRRVVGFDVNLEALRQARRRNPAVPLACGAAERLPYRSGSFDAVVMLEVIEHTACDRSALAEARRVLRPGGTLILSTPHAGLFAWLDPHNVRRFLQRRLPAVCRAAARLARFESGQYTANLERHRHYRLRQIGRLLGPDFRIVAVHRGGLLLYPLVAAAMSVAARLSTSGRLLRPLQRLLNRDFAIRFGRLSYNLMLRAERVR